jgi:hypothetical protein
VNAAPVAGTLVALAVPAALAGAWAVMSGRPSAGLPLMMAAPALVVLAVAVIVIRDRLLIPAAAEHAASILARLSVIQGDDGQGEDPSPVSTPDLTRPGAEAIRRGSARPSFAVASDGEAEHLADTGSAAAGIVVVAFTIAGALFWVLGAVAPAVTR